MATAVQVESIWNGLTDNSGEPLAAGKVYTYSAGTTTPVSLYTSSDKSTSATNPLILDAYGKAQVWADGRYKFVVKTSADVTLYTLDNLLYGFDDTTMLYGGTSTGSANAQIVSVPATVTSYSNGQTISFIAGYTNTGATTLQFNSLSTVTVVKGSTPSSLQSGDLIAGQLYTATYHGGTFRLQDYPSVADVQRSRFKFASGISGTNTIVGTLTPAPSAYEAGMVVWFKAATANTAASTINLNGLGAKAIQRQGAALVGGEIKANDICELVYDGTQFQLLNVPSAPLYVDRTNNRIGINTTSPTFQFVSASSAVDGVSIYGSSAVSYVQLGGFQNDTDGASALKYDRSTGVTSLTQGTRDAQVERLAISSSGLVGINNLSANANLEVSDTSRATGFTGIISSKFSADANGAEINFRKSRGAAVGTNTLISNNDRVGAIIWNGATGSGYSPAASLAVEIDGAPGATNDMPGRIIIATSADGTATPSERVRIDSSGRVGVGVVPTSALHIKADGSLSDKNGLYLESSSVLNQSPSVISHGKRNDSNSNQSFGGRFVAIRENTTAALASGIPLGSFIFGGNYNSSGSIAYPASVSAITDAAWTGLSACAAALIFKTGATSATDLTSNTDYGTERLRITSGGNVGIGTNNPSYQLQLSTDSAAKPTTSTWTIASDSRIKTNIQNYEKGLAEICQVSPITYDYNGKGGIAAGPGGVSILAQDLQPIFPECIGSYKAKLEETDEDEVDILNYNGHAITFALINAVKELNSKIEALEARIGALEA